MNDFLAEITWRGLIHSATEGVAEHLARGQVSGYIGFDPSASSLHVGSLLPIMGLVHFQRAGHRPIAIAGGGTGMIGDPSGKTQERRLLERADIEANLEGIKLQLARFLDFTTPTNPAIIIDNHEWLGKLTVMNFLRDIGKHFSVNEMLAKDSVKSRIDQQQGMSFTEFTYSLLQSYDYLELFDRHRCTLQMGGSDQWGNIVAGVDLVRRLRGAEVYGIVFPLITASSGVKFGKTESGTVWLDSARTSPYRFYQFWFNTDDRDVIRYLKYFTLLPRERIAELGDMMADAPERREAQSALGREVTRLVHGDAAYDQALKASQIFFGGEIGEIADRDLLDIFADVPSVEVDRERLGSEGMSLIDLLVEAAVVKSRGEARRSVEAGGIYLNNIRMTEIDRRVRTNDAIHGRFIVLRKGQKHYTLMKLRSSS